VQIQSPILNIPSFEAQKPAELKQPDVDLKQRQDLDKLHKNLSDPQVNLSLSSFEGLEEQKDIEKLPQPQESQASFIREKLPVLGYATASAMHLFAGLAKSTTILPKGLTKFLDEYSLVLSKLVNVSNYTYKGLEALFGKKLYEGFNGNGGAAWEGIARLAYTAIIPFTPLESIFSASGISSGLTMMEQAQRHKITTKPQNFSEDLKANFKAFKEMWKETFSKSGVSKILGVLKNPDEDKGHAMFLFSWGNFLGAVLGFFVGKKHSSFLGKIASFLRNGGGIGCDYAKFIHPDWNNKMSAIFYLGVSAFDFTKSFTNDAKANILSHFSLALNNFANYFYVNTSKASRDGTFKDYGAIKVAASSEPILAKAA